MEHRIYVTRQLRNPEFASAPRSAGLQQLATLAAVEDQPAELTAEHAAAVVAVIADSAPFRDSFYAAARDLRVVARWGVGFDQVNVAAATRHGVLVTVTPVHMDTVAEYTIAQWLATMKRTYTLNRNAHADDTRVLRCYDVRGSTLGLYGFGRIGQEVAERALPLLGPSGRLLVYDIRPDIQDLALRRGVVAVSTPDALFRVCDTVALHVAGDTAIVGADLLAQMQPHASLINPSRGNLVDDAAVHAALEDGKLYYYVVDDPLNGARAIHHHHPRVIATNHGAGITVESSIRLDQATFDQVTAAVAGRRPAHILNPEALDHPRVQGWLTAAAEDASEQEYIA